MPDLTARALHRGLWVLGTVEALTFAGLLATLVAGAGPGLRAATGLLHGCVYLVGLYVAWRTVDDGRVMGLAVVPGVGALLLARAVTAADREGALRRRS